MEIKKLLNLSPSRRIFLAQKLWDSVPDKNIKLTNSLKKELDSRIQAHENGEMEYLTRDELKKKLQ